VHASCHFRPWHEPLLQLCGTDHRSAVQFAKYQEMQRLFKLEKSAWEEQHGGGKRGFNPAASFNLGSVVGSLQNVLRGATAFQQQPHAAGASTEEPSMLDGTARGTWARVWANLIPHA